MRILTFHTGMKASIYYRDHKFSKMQKGERFHLFLFILLLHSLTVCSQPLLSKTYLSTCPNFWNHF